ncbi:hypothetical protein STSP2_03531 [Anaerohalosphaera lusitana]|uniref:Uncharacterized protein n=1 Tax=Anaerohalosphaera lusitana TaxID=1936003 RepID=A0A1U9NR95_9BACT|nr:hypothetical protein STSP2_03531 [Anaerohalosphaera lusitana]
MDFLRTLEWMRLALCGDSCGVASRRFFYAGFRIGVRDDNLSRRWRWFGCMRFMDVQVFLLADAPGVSFSGPRIKSGVTGLSPLALTDRRVRAIDNRRL